MGVHRRRWSQASAPSETRSPLADECEAFLAGRHVEFAKDAQQMVPTGSWLNLVAHGRIGDLAAVSSGAPAPGRVPCTMGQARALLAKAAIALAQTEEELDDLQRRVFVPLELDVLDAGQPISPRRLVELAYDKLFAPEPRMAPASQRAAGREVGTAIDARSG